MLQRIIKFRHHRDNSILSLFRFKKEIQKNYNLASNTCSTYRPQAVRIQDVNCNGWARTGVAPLGQFVIELSHGLLNVGRK